MPRRRRAARALPDDVLDGLTRPFKELPPKHLYDARGAELFDRICELPEYYPTRTERAILDGARGRDRAPHRRRPSWSSSAPARPPRRACCSTPWSDAGTAVALRPVRRRRAGRARLRGALADEYPGLGIHGIVGDFERHLDAIPRPSRGPPARRGVPGRHDRQLPARRAAALPARARGPARARRLPAARHRPRQGPRRARGRLRRRPGRHRRVQPQRPARPQPRAGRRLPRRALRARRVLRPRARVDRDAPARPPRLPRAHRGARPRGRLRPRRGAAHRDLGQVHAASALAADYAAAGLELAAWLDRPRRAVRAVARAPRPGSLLRPWLPTS